MARKFLTPLDLVQNELQNARIQNLASQPGTAAATPKGVIYYNSTDNTLYWNDGTAWQAAKSGTPAAHATSHQPGGGDAMAVDAAVGTGSLRTLGTGAQQAAVGSHNHVLSALSVPVAAVSMNNQLLTNLLAPSAGTDAANKTYVDNAIQGLDAIASVRCASTGNLGLTGLAAIDGVTPIANDRILVKNQTTATANGVYIAAAGAWARSSDMDIWAEFPSTFVWVEEGTTQADTGWVCTNDASGTLGSTNVTFVQFASAGSAIAGAGLTKTGNTIDVIATDASIVVAADSVGVGYGGTGSAATAARSDHTHAAPAVTRYVINVGGSTAVVVNHALNTRDVQVQVYRVAAPYDTVECDVERTDANNVTVRFAVAPSAAEYRCVVFA